MGSNETSLLDSFQSVLKENSGGGNQVTQATGNSAEKSAPQ
jgi:hypothetical protein